MKLRIWAVYARAFLFLLLLAIGQPAISLGADRLDEISSGAPAHLGIELTKEHYTQMEMQRIRKARVAWVNFDLLLQMGVQVPPEGLTPEFEKRLLDAFAYGVPITGEPTDIFDAAMKKLFSIDGYGGEGTGSNWGSGRAASIGRVQVKGGGRTDKVGESGLNHGHGGMPFSETTREAMYGEINRDLPHGSNRVLLIIDRGTETEHAPGRKERNFMVVREDPLRPAHFIPSQVQPHWMDDRDLFDKLKKFDDVRVQAARKNFARALPGSGSLDERLTAYVERLADQYSTAYALQLYHGATSESNIELSGRFLDFGTETAQPGYGPIKLLEHIEAAGHTQQFKDTLVKSFVTGASSEYKAHPEKVKKLMRAFDRRYRRNLRTEFLKLTGVPDSVLEKIQHTPAGKKLAAEAADELLKLATFGTKELVAKYDVPDFIGDYDLSKILPRLANVEDPVVANIRKELAEFHTGGAGDKVLDEFASAYAKLSQRAHAIAEKDGVNSSALRRFMVEKSSLRSHRRPDAFRWKIFEEDKTLLKEYLNRESSEVIANELQRRIESSRRNFGADSGYTTTLAERGHEFDGSRVHIKYDASQDKVLIHIEPREVGEEWIAFGEKVKSLQNLQARLVLTGAKGKYTPTLNARGLVFAVSPSDLDQKKLSLTLGGREISGAEALHKVVDNSALFRRFVDFSPNRGCAAGFNGLSANF